MATYHSQPQRLSLSVDLDNGGDQRFIGKNIRRQWRNVNTPAEIAALQFLPTGRGTLSTSEVERRLVAALPALML